MIWAKYITAVADKLRLKAAAWSAAIALCGGVQTINFIDHHWLIIPIALGSALGTAIGIKR